MVDPGERACHLASLSFERMGKEGMAPTPENYTLWYTYYAGEDPDLVRAIDLMVKAHQPFTPERCEDLFQRFFRTDGEAKAIRVTGERTEAALANLLKLLAVTGSDAERYASTLSILDSMLSEPLSVGQLRALVGEIGAATRYALQQNRRVQFELSEANRNLSQLRADIQTARREVLTDTLTGIGNRRAFDLALFDETNDAGTAGTPLALLMIDIDHFRQFNDTHGPLVGDHVLKLVARLLTQTVKGRDTATRYGGEEFAIILPETTLANATILADNIRLATASRQIINKLKNELFGSVTLSAGVAQYRYQEPLREFVHRAEQALYTAKRTGRNKVCSELDTLRQASAGGPIYGPRPGTDTVDRKEGK